MRHLFIRIAGSINLLAVFFVFVLGAGALQHSYYLIGALCLMFIGLSLLLNYYLDLYLDQLLDKDKRRRK